VKRETHTQCRFTDTGGRRNDGELTSAKVNRIRSEGLKKGGERFASLSRVTLGSNNRVQGRYLG
jgi:hypothetical protein